ncbi:MAG: GLPGLI family protein [Muricauda sp.]|nr:GLPGLI family protein [Allomuricauda sp.]MBA4745214.1 GLPGLI family protein [Allomuricauda sp.]
MYILKTTRILLIGALLFPLAIIAQINSGVAEYKVILQQNTNTKLKGPYKSDIDNIEKQAQKLRFELAFNQKASAFSLVKNLPIDKNDFNAKMAITIFDGDKMYYTNLKEAYIIEQKTFLGKKFQVKTDLEDVEWKLVDDQKQVSDYLCYKAIGKRYAMSKNYETFETEVVAWYCPEIPIRTGPFEAVGLPGLVLQLDLKGRSVVLEDLDLGKEVQVENPIKGNVVSQKEYDSIYKKRVKAQMPR